MGVLLLESTKNSLMSRPRQPREGGSSRSYQDIASFTNYILHKVPTPSCKKAPSEGITADILSGFSFWSFVLAEFRV